MALTGLIGQPLVFQVLFLDSVNQPIAATGVAIEVFRYDDTTGDKVLLVASTAMTPAVPVETGRFVHVYTIPTSLLEGAVLYAEMSGTDPGSGNQVFERVEVNIVDPNRIDGITASFW